MVAALLVTAPAAAQTSGDTKPAAPQLLRLGDSLTGQLSAIRSRKRGKRAAPTFQLASAARRLPSPGDLCNLETGPETFQIVASSDAEVAQLKPLIGKQVTLKVAAVSCAEEAGIMSEAVVSKWTLVR
jgi:hypothetical protein